MIVIFLGSLLNLFCVCWGLLLNLFICMRIGILYLFVSVFVFKSFWGDIVYGV